MNELCRTNKIVGDKLHLSSGCPSDKSSSISNTGIAMVSSLIALLWIRPQTFIGGSVHDVCLWLGPHWLN